MRTFVVALLVVISAPAFADKPAPPWLRIQADTEVEIPKGPPLEVTVGVSPHEDTDAETTSDCSLTQGAHHIENKTAGDSDCTLALINTAGFVPGPATFSARINIGGVWSEPSTVQIKLVALGNLWVNLSGSQGAIYMSNTHSATVSKGTLSFIVFTQNYSGKPPEAEYPFLGRITVTIPPNGKIDQLVPLEARWLEPLEKSTAWQHLGNEAALLLQAKALRIRGTYSAATGASIDVLVPGWDRIPVTVVFRPATFKQQVNTVDCEALSPAQRKLHSVCTM